jgi:signal peptidase I
MVSELINPASSTMVGLFEDVLNRGLRLRIKVSGKSMAPFLKGGEVLTIKKTALTSLRKGDLLFFRNADGYPVLHRIVSKKFITAGQFIFKVKGDALIVCDGPVPGAEVLGKVCEIDNMNTVIGIKHIDMESTLWKIVNYLLALINFAESKIYHILGRLVMGLKSLKRKVQK